LVKYKVQSESNFMRRVLKWFTESSLWTLQHNCTVCKLFLCMVPLETGTFMAPWDYLVSSFNNHFIAFCTLLVLNWLSGCLFIYFQPWGTRWHSKTYWCGKSRDTVVERTGQWLLWVGNRKTYPMVQWLSVHGDCVEKYFTSHTNTLYNSYW